MICHFFDRTFDYNKGRILHGNCLFMNDLTLTLHPIAVIHTPYKEKFSVPRQPDLVQDGIGIVELLPPYNSPEAVRGLEQFSHLWLIFQFDKVPHGKWQSTVRPPRLGRQSTCRRIGFSRYTSSKSARLIQSRITPSRMYSWTCFSTFRIRGSYRWYTYF